LSSAYFILEVLGCEKIHRGPRSHPGRRKNTGKAVSWTLLSDDDQYPGCSDFWR